MPSYLVARNLDVGMEPSAGWLASLRSVLGLSIDEVAVRLDKHRVSVSKAEAAERDGAISLRNLRKHAAVLGCEVEIRLVAARSFEAMADQSLAEINLERKKIRKPRLRKPAPREDPATATEAEEEWDRKQFKYGMQRGIA